MLYTESQKLILSTFHLFPPYKKAEDRVEIVKISCEAKKRQIRINYDWDGKEANFANSVLGFVKEYLFSHFKFLKDGWMEYDKRQDSFSTFV